MSDAATTTSASNRAPAAPPRTDGASLTPEPLPRAVVLYDDACPMCTFQVKLLTWLDWFHVATMLPLSQAGEQGDAFDPQLARIPREDLLSAMHVLTRDRRIVRGARAVRHLALRIPLLFPMAIIMWVPGVIYLAEACYKLIAKNRYSISKVFGCDGACSITPAKQRDGEDVTLRQGAEQADESTPASGAHAAEHDQTGKEPRT